MSIMLNLFAYYINFKLNRAISFQEQEITTTKLVLLQKIGAIERPNNRKKRKNRKQIESRKNYTTYFMLF